MNDVSPELQPDQRTTSFEHVKLVCEDFNAAWQSVSRTETIAWQPPRIDAYLKQVGRDAQPALLRNLLAIDIDNRRTAGEQPHVEDYLERFPQQAALIRNAFLQQSMIGSLVSSKTVAPTSAAVQVPAASRLGDYQLVRELGRGGMGVVYQARHLLHGNIVALKTLPTDDAKALHRFKHEFRTLADISHPNLIGLHTLEADGCHWFFTMDLHDGTDFFTYVRPSGVVDEARLRSALAQLFTGVMALHGHHVVHRDLKPSNVMVTGDGQVIVLDFGLVLEFAEIAAMARAGEIAGTPKYMAPEQAVGATITAASDWYAVGVMLFEALTGCLPFTGSMQKVLRDKQELEPPPLPQDAGYPQDLADLCIKLLARDPAQRPDALAIANVISSQTVSASVTLTPGAQLVGRVQQVALLQDVYHLFERDNQPRTIFIRGRSGEGKTSLAEHFLDPVRAHESLIVLSGRCYDRESVPFKALDSLIDALASFLQALPDDEMASLIPEEVGVLCQVFPVLQRVPAIANMPAVQLSLLDEHQVRQRAFTALRQLLFGLSRRRPLILFVDDLQWGDADSAKALFEVLRPPDAPAILFLGTYRSDETDTSHFLKQWEEHKRQHDVVLEHQDVNVGPLSIDACTELVIRLLELDTELIRRRALEFHAQTGGNPFLLIELVGCFDPRTDSFESMEIRDVLAQKLARLPAEAAQLLEVVAVSGQALSSDEVAKAAGHDLLPVGTLTRMRNERIVRLVGGEASHMVDTYHDRVRETILDQIETGRRITIHRTLAENIEASVGNITQQTVAALERGEFGGGDVETAIPRVYDLSYHFSAAGEKRKAWQYAFLAAQQARRQYALEVASEQFALAKQNVDETLHAVRYRIGLVQGQTLMLLGRYDEAIEQLDEAKTLSDDPVAKAAIECLLGKIAFKRGWAGRSISILETALRRLGCWVPRTKLGLMWGLIKETAVQCAHSVLPKSSPKENISDRSALIGEILTELSHCYLVGNALRLTWVHLAALNQNERCPDSPTLAFSFATHGLVMQSSLPGSLRGKRYSQRSIALRREFNDIWGLANSCLNQAMLDYSAARFEECIDNAEKAVDLYEKSGDQFEIKASIFHSCFAHNKLGNIAAAIKPPVQRFVEGVQLSDDNTGHYTLYGLTAFTCGNLPFAELRSCFGALPDNVVATSAIRVAEGIWHLNHSRTEKALQALENGYEIVKKEFNVFHISVATVPWLITCLRRHAETLEPTDPQEANRLHRRAFGLARRAVWIMRLLYPVHYPHALRELSLAYAGKGRIRKALHLADKSCAVARSQKAKYEHAECLLLRGRLARRLGLPEAEEQMQMAESSLAERDMIINEEVARYPLLNTKGA